MDCRGSIRQGSWASRATLALHHTTAVDRIRLDLYELPGILHSSASRPSGSSTRSRYIIIYISYDVLVCSVARCGASTVQRPFCGSSSARQGSNDDLTIRPERLTVFQRGKHGASTSPLQKLLICIRSSFAKPRQGLSRGADMSICLQTPPRAVTIPLIPFSGSSNLEKRPGMLLCRCGFKGPWITFYSGSDW